MRQVLLGTTLAVTLALAFTPASAKTVKQCNVEYAANKAAIQGVQKKSAFIAACRAESRALPGAAATGAAATPTGDKVSPPVGMGQLPKPTAKDLAEERKLKHDMNICIGC